MGINFNKRLSNRNNRGETPLKDFQMEQQNITREDTGEMPDALATQEQETALEVPAGAWGANESLTSEDITIPRILLGQPTSEAVALGDRKLGEYFDSITGDIMAFNNEVLEVIVINAFKTWLIMNRESTDDSFGFNSVEAWTPQNAHLPFESDDGLVKHYLTQNYLVLLPSEIAKKKAFPYLLPLKSKSLKESKKIGLTIKKLAMRNLPSANFTFKLDRTINTHEATGGRYAVVKALPGRASTAEEIQEAFKWFQVMKSGDVNIQYDNPEEASEKITTNEIPF